MMADKSRRACQKNFWLCFQTGIMGTRSAVNCRSLLAGDQIRQGQLPNDKTNRANNFACKQAPAVA